jgi:hypothetical protein
MISSSFLVWLMGSYANGSPLKLDAVPGCQNDNWGEP